MSGLHFSQWLVPLCAVQLCHATEKSSMCILGWALSHIRVYAKRGSWRDALTTLFRNTAALPATAAGQPLNGHHMLSLWSASFLDPSKLTARRWFSHPPNVNRRRAGTRGYEAKEEGAQIEKYFISERKPSFNFFGFFSNPSFLLLSFLFLLHLIYSPL